MTTEQLNQAKNLDSKMTSLDELLKRLYNKDFTGYTLSYRSDTMSSKDYTKAFPRDEVLESRFFEVIRDRLNELKQEFESL